jgi:S13-like protein
VSLAPNLTQEQRALAYRRSLELRRARASLKELIATGVVTVRQAFNYEDAQGMRVYQLLTAVPCVGRIKALAMLEEAGIPAHNSVRACGPRQREALFGLLFKR